MKNQSLTHTLRWRVAILHAVAVVINRTDTEKTAGFALVTGLGIGFGLALLQWCLI